MPNTIRAAHDRTEYDGREKFGKSEIMRDNFSDCPKKQFEKLSHIRRSRQNLSGHVVVSPDRKTVPNVQRLFDLLSISLNNSLRKKVGEEQKGKNMLKKETVFQFIFCVSAFLIIALLFPLVPYAQDEARITLNADAGPDQRVYEGDVVTLDGSYSAGNDIAYQWTQIDGETATLSDMNAERPTFTAPDIDDDEESLIFQLTITDNTGLTKEDTCIIEVTEKVIPGANAGADQNVYEGNTVTLDGSRSTGNDITYQWIQIEG